MSTDRAEHSSEGEKRCHPHSNSARYGLWGDEEGEPGKDLEENDDDIEGAT